MCLSSQVKVLLKITSYNCIKLFYLKGGEGGWHECRWSITLNECISPSYQPLYCAGGVCGLVLSGGNKDRCPQPCSSYTQCSTCLRHTHCGWCALNVLNKTGQVNVYILYTRIQFTIIFLI